MDDIHDDSNDPAISAVDGAALARYVADACRAAERRAVEQWLAEDPSRRATIAALRTAARVQGQPLHDPDIDTAWRRAAGEIEQDPALPASAQLAGRARRRPVVSPQYQVATVAACAAVVALAVIGIRHRAAVSGRDYVTAASQRAAVTLTDGTHFVLAPGSHLHIPIDYGSRVRAVELDGEGYFTVAHDAAHPFSVHTRTAVATDIGTAFDVRAYHEDAGVRVAVTAGRVVVTAAASRTEGDSPLQAGDVAVLVDTTLVVTHQADVTALTGWTTGHLTFDRTPLSEALEDLSRWYDLDLRLGDSALRSHAISGSFDRQSPAEMLDAIALVANARYVRDGHRVTFLANPERR